MGTITRRWLWGIWLLALLLLLAPLPVAAQQDDDQARALLAALNAWRLEQGLSPLLPNPILQRMAVDQAQYVLSLPQIPAGAAIHTGRRGEDPRTRALYAEYNWPTFGSREQIVLSEIASARPNVSGAIGFWRGSDIHNRIVTNGWYREAGVAAIPYRLGFLYLVVVGAQPNVLPALADPRAGVIYLTNESYPRGVGNWLRSATEVRLFDHLGRPLTDWQTWQRALPLPPTTSPTLTVLYRGGGAETVTQISLLESDVLLPPYADAWNGASLVAVLPTLTPSGGLLGAQPSVPLLATNTPAPPPTETLPVGQLIVLSTATPIPAQPVAPPAPVDGPLVTLVYNAGTLTLSADRAGINVGSLVLVNGGSTLLIGNLNAQFIRGTLTSFGARDCLFITVDPAQRSAPSSCGFASTTFLTPDRALWRSDFRVERAGQLLANCRAADGRCTVPAG